MPLGSHPSGRAIAIDCFVRRAPCIVLLASTTASVGV